MRDRQREIVATVVGAVVGGMAGYMLFTSRGRALRARIEPAIEDVARELMQLRGTVNRAMGVASQGWHVLNEAIGDRDTQPGAFSSHQSRPF